MIDLYNTEPKTLAEATVLNQLRIKKIQETLQQFDEQTEHENFFKKFREKWNLKLELRKARSIRPQKQVTYTKELLTVLFSLLFLYFLAAFKKKQKFFSHFGIVKHG